MSVWVFLFIATAVTAGLFFSLYVVLARARNTKNHRGNPRFGLAYSTHEGEILAWMRWNSKAVDFEFYRIKLSFFSPQSALKESAFSVTLDLERAAHPKNGFIQPIRLPADFIELFTSVNRRAIVTVDFRTVDGFVLHQNYDLATTMKIFRGEKKMRIPELTAFEAKGPDQPAVSTLDFNELVERKKKLIVLAEQALAKAARAKPAAPVAAPT